MIKDQIIKLLNFFEQIAHSLTKNLTKIIFFDTLLGTFFVGFF